MSNVEQQLISKIIYDGDYNTVIDNQITSDFFTGRFRRAFIKIQKHMIKYGSLPSESAFDKFGLDVELTMDINDSMEYYCDEIRQKKKHNLMVDAIEEMTEYISSLETEQAYEIMNNLVTTIQNDVQKSDRVVINKDTEKRLERYKQRTLTNGVTGLSTGIPRLDMMLSGFSPEELIILIAFTNSGKTWFEAILTVLMAKLGYKVLFFTTEMSSEAISDRIDAIYCNLNYTRFKRGKLTPQEYKTYEDYLKNIKDNEDFNIVIEQVYIGVNEISAKIDQHKPDMVFVDGAYLLTADSSEEDWRALVSIFRGLKRVARLKKVPVFASTQSTSEVINLSNIAFAKHIRADADIMLGIEIDEEMRADREMALKLLKMREGENNSKILFNWKFSEPDGMDYSTIYAEKVDGSRYESDMKNKGEKVVEKRDIDSPIMVI